jgi:transcriptional regulator with PAS, ATPase and Fis domain
MRRARKTADTPSRVTRLVGSSAAIRHLQATIEKISRYQANVLILGESGTGKELIARALHDRGLCRQYPFVPVNCASLGRELLENELFGHEKGAFTGANDHKRGLFELADGGTLFLDEIGEMDLSTQAKLLRVLERQEFRRVGGTVKIRVSLTVVAATNKNLGDAIRAGRFREDLYYRLKVVSIAVPPLRARKEDIPALVEAFIRDFNERYDGHVRSISPAALKRVMEYDWPGNVRELKHAVESAAILASSDTLDIDSFEDPVVWPKLTEVHPTQANDFVAISVGTTIAEAERALILATLGRYETKREAAHALGVGLRTLYTKLREYRIPSLQSERWRSPEA